MKRNMNQKLIYMLFTFLLNNKKKKKNDLREI